MTKTNQIDVAKSVEDARAVLARWEAEQAALEAELESLQSRAGGEVLDDPKAAERLPRVLADLRDRLDLAGRAIEAQRPRVAAAESAYLLAEADRLRAPVKRAENALARHHERTAELLRLLEEHEGVFVPKALLDFEQQRNTAGVKELVLTRSEVLENDLTALRRPVLVLEELAAGRDPMQHPDLRDCVPHQVFPSCVWGADALVPCPAYVRFSKAAAELAAQSEQVDA